MPPLLGCAAGLGEKAIACLGFRNKAAVILEEDFRAAGAKVSVATDDVKEKIQQSRNNDGSQYGFPFR